MQRRASLALGEYRDALLANPESIELPAVQLEERRVRVAELDSQVVGFSVLLQPVAGICEIDGMFVEPAHWRLGIGRALLADATNLAIKENARAIEVTANQHAKAFYLKFGFNQTGSVQTRFGPAARMTFKVL
jgi:GNAT superfamily N-acetyltransferase